ncbi:MAG: SAM-dependent methyltransferase [Chthoniobacterales bacterium]
MRQNEASSTAVLVAAGLVFLASSAKTVLLVPSEAVKLGSWLLKNYSTFSRCSLSLLHAPLFRCIVSMLERIALPGIVEHYAQRKRVIESLARSGIEDGFRQLIVLGAGFDTLSVRFAREFSGLGVWEIDHPATQTWKLRGIEACGLQSPGLRFIAQNFADFAGEEMQSLPGDFARDEQTLWAAEGLLMYFSPADVKQFFRMIRASSAVGSRIVFTWVQPDADGKPRFAKPARGVNRWLEQRKEAFAWGIPRGAMKDFLNDLGFRMLELSEELTRDVDRLHVGEYITLAEIR